MRATNHRITAILFGVAAVMSLACDDPTGPPIQEIQRNTGIIQLSVVTSGPDPDPDGYYLYVENIGKVDLPPNGTRTVTGVKAGQWELVLAGLSGNCALERPPVQKVNVTLGAAGRPSGEGLGCLAIVGAARVAKSCARHEASWFRHDGWGDGSFRWTKTGFRVPPGDVAALTGAIERLLDDIGLARRFGERGFQRASELFSIEKNVRDLCALIKANLA